MKKTITTVLASALFALVAQAQQATTATGGDASSSGGTVAYSVGQVVYTVNTDFTGSVNQGVQQPYEVLTVGVRETELNISLSVFPNPTATDLTLNISNYNNEELSYQIFDMHGKLLGDGQVTAQQTQIKTANLPSSTYFVNVLTQENPSAGTSSEKIQSFKIIKN
jgi:spore coat protein U-like protein